MTDANERIDLSALDEEYGACSAPERQEAEEVPDGNYAVLVQRVELKVSKAGNPMLSWWLRVTAGPHDGRMIFRHNMLQSGTNLEFLKADLSVCGLQLEKLSQLEDNLSKLLDVGLEVTKKQKGEFSNVYLNRMLGEKVESRPSPMDDSDEPPF